MTMSHGPAAPAAEDTPAVRKSRGQVAYEADLKRRPAYHDGAARRTWAELGPLEQYSWERDPTPSGFRGRRDDGLGLDLDEDGALTP